MKTLKDFKAELLTDEQVKRAHKEFAPEFVAALERARKAPPINAPADSVAFLDWLNEPVATEGSVETEGRDNTNTQSEF